MAKIDLSKLPSRKVDLSKLPSRNKKQKSFGSRFLENLGPKGIMEFPAFGIPLRAAGRAVEGFKEGVDVAAETSEQISARQRKGEIGFGGAFVRQAGAGLQALALPVGRAAAGVVSPVTEGIVAPAVETSVQSLDSLTKNTQNLFKSMIGTEKIEDVQKSIDDLDEGTVQDLMNAARTVESILTFTGAAQAPKLAAGALTTAGGVAKVAGPALKEGFEAGFKKGASARGAVTSKLDAISTAKNLNKLAGLEDAQIKFTTEILQPLKELKKTDLDLTPRSVEEAAKVIKKAKTFEEIGGQFKAVSDEAIEKVNAQIAKKANEIIGDFLSPLRKKVAELEKDATKSKIAKRYKEILLGEEQNLKIAGGSLRLDDAQIKKIQANKDLSDFFDQKDPGPLQKAELQARDLVREGLMKEIETIAGGSVGQLNRVFAGLSDARKLLQTVSARQKVAITPTAIQKFVEKIPFLKTILTGRIDSSLVPRSSTLFDILGKRTKEIERLRRKASILKKKTNVKDKINQKR